MYEVTRDAEGKELSRVEKSNTITKAPVTEAVVRGTKPKTTVTEEVVLKRSHIRVSFKMIPNFLLEPPSSKRQVKQASARSYMK